MPRRGISFRPVPSSPFYSYVVPVNVLEHFLEDVSRHGGKYLGFPRMGVVNQRLESPALRQSLKMSPDQTGVLVTSIEVRGNTKHIFVYNFGSYHTLQRRVYCTCIYFAHIIFVLSWPSSTPLESNYRNILGVRPAGRCIFFAKNDHPGGNSKVGGEGSLKKKNTSGGKVWSYADFKRPPCGFLCVLYYGVVIEQSVFRKTAGKSSYSLPRKNGFGFKC